MRAVFIQRFQISPQDVPRFTTRNAAPQIARQAPSPAMRASASCIACSAEAPSAAWTAPMSRAVSRHARLARNTSAACPGAPNARAAADVMSSNTRNPSAASAIMPGIAPRASCTTDSSGRKRAPKTSCAHAGLIRCSQAA